MAHMPHCDAARHAKRAASAIADIEPETLDLKAALFTPPIRATEPPSIGSRSATDELHRKYPGTTLAQADFINEVVATGPVKSKRTKRKKVKQATGDEDIQESIAAVGAAMSSKGKWSSVEGSTGGGNEIIETAGEEVSSDEDR